MSLSIEDKLIYRLDFVDLKILEYLLNNDSFVAFPVLVKGLSRINVWNREMIRRRITLLKKEKLIYFEEHRSPMIIELYLNREKETRLLVEMLRCRILR